MLMSNIDLIAVIGSVFGSALGLGMMMMRIAARIDADRRAFQAEAAQDRRALQATTDRHQASNQATMDRNQATMDRFQAGMDRFQAEMQRIAERQSRVEAVQEVHHRAPGGTI